MEKSYCSRTEICARKTAGSQLLCPHHDTQPNSHHRRFTSNIEKNRSTGCGGEASDKTCHRASWANWCGGTYSEKLKEETEKQSKESLEVQTNWGRWSRAEAPIKIHSKPSWEGIQGPTKSRQPKQNVLGWDKSLAIDWQKRESLSLTNTSHIIYGSACK